MAINMRKLSAVQEFRLKLYPKDFNVVRKFYEDELGYPIISEWSREESKGTMFDIGGTILELLWPSNDITTSYRADVSWRVSNVWELYEVMKNKPYLVRGLQNNAWGDSSFHIQDPEGFKITFFTKTRELENQ